MSAPQQQQVPLNPEIQHIIQYFIQGANFENHTVYNVTVINAITSAINTYANNKSNEVAQWKTRAETLALIKS